MTTIQPRGFARLDFEEIKRVAHLTGFDIRAHAAKKRSCGPGCDYLVQDKRYVALLLIRHVERMLKELPGDVPEQAREWLGAARIAEREYAGIERAIHPVVRRVQTDDSRST